MNGRAGLVGDVFQQVAVCLAKRLVGPASAGNELSYLFPLVDQWQAQAAFDFIAD